MHFLGYNSQGIVQEMIVLNAHGFLQPDKIDTAKAASSTNKARALTEKGCLKFDYYFSGEDATKFVFVEEWETKADLDAHFAHENFGAFMAALSDCLAGPPDIRIFESTLLE